MKNISLTITMILLAIVSYAQRINKLGIGTKTPVTTLDVVANAAEPTVLDGITIPKLTCSQIINKALLTGWGTDQLGTILYITETASSNCTPSPPVSDINTKGDGFYILMASGSTMEFMRIGLNSERINLINWLRKGNASIDSASDFLGTTDMVDLVLKTNNNEIARINAEGQVGIGTNDPKVTLHIAGQPNDPNYLDGLSIPRLSCDQIANKQTNSDWIANAPAGTIIYIENASCTVTPQQPPYSNINTSGSGLYVFDGNEFIKLLEADEQSNSWTITGNTGTNPNINFIGTTDAVDFVTRIQSNKEAMRITTDGYVGINTSAAPLTHLEVNGNITNGNWDFILGHEYYSRGDSGSSRALTKAANNELVLNAFQDFDSIRVDGPFKISTLQPPTTVANTTPLGRDPQGYITPYRDVKYSFFETLDFDQSGSQLDIYNGVVLDYGNGPISNTLLRVRYTPFYQNSKLFITCDALYRLTSLSGNDYFACGLGVYPITSYSPTMDNPHPRSQNSPMIGLKYQRFYATPILDNNAPELSTVGGGGTRSSTLFPISGQYMNTSTNQKHITIGIYSNNSGSGISFLPNNTETPGDQDFGIQQPCISCRVIEIPE